MKLSQMLTIALASLVATAASAQAPAPPPRAALAPPPPRGRGPALTPSVQAAQAAVAACAANGYKVTALITDSGGDPVVLLSGDGAAVRTQGAAKTKGAAAP